ncbi:unnamed protein product [Rhizopus stolonifer]
MLFLKHILTTGLLLASVTNAQQNQNSVIDYNVIALLNQTTFKSMSVVVDNVSYPLESNKTFPIIFTGKAPLAQSGYSYAKMYASNDGSLVEPFLRQPVNESTPHEFFNRTWNTHENGKFPQVYSPLDMIHRIESGLHRDNEIPTIHIVGNATMLNLMQTNTTSDMSVDTNISYVSLHDAFQYEGVEISIAGHSARMLPKLSYNLKLKKKDNLYGYRRLKLRSLALDPSYIREQISYDFIKSMGLISSEFSYVRVFMNDQELGLFGIIDTFKGGWLSNVFANGSSSYDNGYLYQALSGSGNATSDLSYHKNSTIYTEGQYKVKVKASGGKKNNYDPLIEFTKFIADAPTNGTDAVEKWNEKLDIDSFLRFTTLEVLTGYADGYLATLNNYYVYQNPGSSKFTYICADMDLTFGNSAIFLSKLWSGNYTAYPGMTTRPLSKKLLQIPEFNEKLNQMVQNVTAQLINPDVTNTRIDNIVSMIREDVEWDNHLFDLKFAAYLPLISSANITDILNNLTDNASTDDNIKDFAMRFLQKVPLDTAVNGPTGHPSLAGVKEWVNAVHQNTTKFYSQEKHITINL